jgi:GNAT superfamily N-acetyltransferase
MTVRQLEEIAANAWPGLRCALVDGWMVRFAQGHTRRANSVLPWSAGGARLEDRIARCEALFRLEGQDSVFKIFPEAQPEDLDAQLADRGYERKASSQVLVLETLAPAPPLPAGWRVSTSPRLSAGWFQFQTGSSGLDPSQAAVSKAILEAIVPERRFVLLEGSEGLAACALIVLEDGWAGIFDLMVRKEWRGRGLGRATVLAALAEAARAGARRSYLQVLDDNAVALNLYGSLGYRPWYPYWFRVKARPSF